MCIRDRFHNGAVWVIPKWFGGQKPKEFSRIAPWGYGRLVDGLSVQADPVSYTHLDVYKRQRQRGAHMKLTPVESSHIAAIGYLEDERVLLVRYKDGALYARTGVPVESWYDFEGSVSKGGWLNHHREYSAILISKGAAVDSQSTRCLLYTSPPAFARAIVLHHQPID